MAMKTFTLSGTLTAVTPLAVSPPGAAFRTDRKGSSPARLMRAGFNHGSAYIPASTPRHLLREHLSLVILGALQPHGRTLPLASVLALSRGFTKIKLTDDTIKRRKAKGKKANGDEAQTEDPAAGEDIMMGAEPEVDEPSSGADTKAASVKKASTENAKSYSEAMAHERLLRERNPFLGFLGAWKLPSELRVRNIMPRGENALGVSSGIVRKHLPEDMVALLSDDDIAQYKVLADEVQSTERKDTGIVYYSEAGWEEIVAGTECDWGLQIHRATDLKIGAILAALRDFATDPVMGAHQACGRGEVAISLNGTMIEHRLLENPVEKPVGDLTLARGQFAVTGDLQRCLEVFDTEARAGFPGLDLTMAPLADQDDD